MKALTIWQPWASLIIAGAKPYEFRRWSYASRFPSLVGQRIVLHAGARRMPRGDLTEILQRIADGESGLDAAIAKPIVLRCLEGLRQREQILPLAAGMGTAILGKPVRAFDLFKDKVADSSRLDQHIYAWPLTEIRPFEPYEPRRGAQGFWKW